MRIQAELKRIEQLIKQAEAIRDQIKVAAENTKTVLDVCDALGVVAVGIGARDETFKDSAGHPFGYDGSIFVDGRDKAGWPLAWAVAQKAGVSGGCGNGGQHQTRGQFLNGVYRCVDGVWQAEGGAA